ncbi:hypothetical protein MRX96_012926 [Rhipicephalus microplus]
MSSRRSGCRVWAEGGARLYALAAAAYNATLVACPDCVQTIWLFPRTFDQRRCPGQPIHDAGSVCRLRASKMARLLSCSALPTTRHGTSCTPHLRNENRERVRRAHQDRLIQDGGVLLGRAQSRTTGSALRDDAVIASLYARVCACGCVLPGSPQHTLIHAYATDARVHSSTFFFFFSSASKVYLPGRAAAPGMAAGPLLHITCTHAWLLPFAYTCTLREGCYDSRPLCVANEKSQRCVYSAGLLADMQKKMQMG